MAIPHTPTFLLLHFFPKEVEDRDVPLGAQLFALGLHPLLCSLARLICHNGSVLSYSDDLHLIGSPSTVAVALKARLQSSPPLEAPLSLDCRLSTIGLALSHGKSSILMGKDVTPHTR